MLKSSYHKYVAKSQITAGKTKNSHRFQKFYIDFIIPVGTDLPFDLSTGAINSALWRKEA